MATTHELSRYESDNIIANDRDLLSALGLSDAVAATYVRKSRQTLNNQLGARKNGGAPNDYFKPAELLMLVLAASRECPDLGEGTRELVRRYIADTRGPSAKSKHERSAYELVMETLSSEGLVGLDDAVGVIFLLPDFMGMSREHAEALAELRLLASRIEAMDARPWTLIISSTTFQAKRAAEELGLDGCPVHTVAHDNAEHYMPSVFVYEGNDKSTPFLITEQGTFVFAPVYRAPMMLTCIKDMLSTELKEELFQRARGYQARALR